MSCKTYTKTGYLNPCDNKKVNKKIVYETLNGVIVGNPGLVVTKSSPNCKDGCDTDVTGFTPTNLSGTLKFDAFGNNPSGLDHKSGYTLDGYKINSLCNSVEIQVSSCPQHVITAIDVNGHRLATLDKNGLTTATRVAKTHVLPKGTVETQDGVLQYLHTVSGLSSITLTDIDFKTLEFHDVLGGREGSVLVKETTTNSPLDLALSEKLHGCNASINDLMTLTGGQKVLDEDTQECINELSGEIIKTKTFTIGV